MASDAAGRRGVFLFAPNVATLLDKYAAIGVAEVMNFPGVIAGDPRESLRAHRHRGAAPGRRSRPGTAEGRCAGRLYLAAGVESDHECTELGEAEEKQRKGMWVFIRQGSASQNLRDLIPMVLAHGTDHVALCSDDREPDTLLEIGHLDDCLRLAGLAAGVSEIDALVMATLNPAEYHGFTELGSTRPGYQADILCFDTLSGFHPSRVFPNGELVALDGAIVPGAVASHPAPGFMRRSVHTLERYPPPRRSMTGCGAEDTCARSASTTARSPPRLWSPTLPTPTRR